MTPPPLHLKPLFNLIHLLTFGALVFRSRRSEGRDFFTEVLEDTRVFMRLRAKGFSAVKVPRGFSVVEVKNINLPWVRSLVVRNRETGEVRYLVDEVPLNRDEKRVFNRIVDLLYWELRPPPPDADPYKYFASEARKVIARFRVRLGRTPGISWGKILYYVERDTVGFGPIDALMRDPDVEDISCSGVGKPIYVWLRRYEYVPTNIVFESERELDVFITRLVHKTGKHISVAFPVVDAILPGGHRLAATYRREVSTSGSTFTIRKFREDPITISDMISWGTVSPELAAYLWTVIESKMCGLVLGITGAGKTSTLNSLATLLRPNVKVVTIEDTPELKLPLENWVQLVARPSYGLGMHKIGEVSLYDLVKVALRYRPDVIIVGEVRGEEAYVLFQAMASVTWDTPVLIMDSKGRVELVPIGSFADRFYDGSEEGVREVSGYYVLSHEGFKAVWRPVRYVLRHWASEVYEVRYGDGGVVRATGSHSVFVMDPESLELREKRVSELGPGDLLVTFVKGGAVSEDIEPFGVVQGLPAGVGSWCGPIGAQPSSLAPGQDFQYLTTFPGKLSNGLVRTDNGLLVFRTRSRELAREVLWAARLRGHYSGLRWLGRSLEVSVDLRNPLRNALIPVVALNRLVRLLGLSDALLRDIKALPAKLAPKELLAGVIERIRELRPGVKGGAGRLYSRLLSLIYGELSVYEVKDARRVRYDGYVYDVSVPGAESFFGGDVPILLHNTGHGGVTSLHAEHIEAAVKRLTSPPMNIPPAYIPLANFAMVITRVRTPEGVVRRVSRVWEIEDYDKYITISEWDPVTDAFKLYPERSFLLKSVAESLGRNEVWVEEELGRRATVLEWMSLKGVRHYRDVARYVRMYYTRPEEVFKIASLELKELRDKY